MKLSQKLKSLPAASAFISFTLLVLLVSLTSPLNNIGFAILFFALALIFLISLGHLIIMLQSGRVGRKDSYRIAVLSLFLIVFLMFRSSQSLSLVDGLILVLIAFGLIFYGARRSL